MRERTIIVYRGMGTFQEMAESIGVAYSRNVLVRASLAWARRVEAVLERAGYRAIAEVLPFGSSEFLGHTLIVQAGKEIRDLEEVDPTDSEEDIAEDAVDYADVDGLGAAEAAIRGKRLPEAMDN